VDGHYRIVARIVDAAGRPTSPTQPLAIKVDRTEAPLSVSLRQDTGVSSSDGITTMADLAISGQEPRAVVQFSHTFNAADADTGELAAPVTSCLCYGGTITDAAGNRHRKQALPPVAV
jgi:hypothetical protein